MGIRQRIECLFKGHDWKLVPYEEWIKKVDADAIRCNRCKKAWYPKK